jgi:hypothetical protein
LFTHPIAGTCRRGQRVGRKLLLASLLGLALAGAGARGAGASPELALDDPIYLELARLRSSGALPLYLGGLRPLSEARAHALLRAAGQVPPPRLVSGDLRGPWLAPVHRLQLRAVLARDHLRPYSTERHPRYLAGGVAITCEHREGERCGEGAGLAWALDSAVGYGAWLSAATRLRAVLGSEAYAADLALDRAYASAELGPVRFLAGRHILVLGPSSRTQAMWGDHAPPLDHLRLSTSRPIPLLGGAILRASGLFFVGRLADPQTFHGSLVDGTRIQIDLLDTAELGLTHIIQLGGDGSPDFTFADYVLEHARHNTGGTTPAGFANHRLSADLAISRPDLAGLRVYYEIAAEDMRDQVWSMLRRDADHVLGLEIDRLAARAALLVELTLTGVRSHEHDVFATGLTSGGRIAGDPLGPSSAAAHFGLRLRPADDAFLFPWLEVVQQASDLYDYSPGQITRTQDLPDELRIRAGARAAFLLGPDLRVELSALAERVTTADFIPGHTRWNAAAEATATWTPGWRVGGEPF